MKINLNILKILSSLLVLLVSIRYSCAQSGEQVSEEVLNHEQWEELSENIDYTETYKEFEKKDKTLKEKKRKERNPINLHALKPILIAIIIGILAVLLFLVMNKFFKFFDERVTNTELKATVENLDENIHNADFDYLLNQALSNNEFKLAIRILYLKIIKQLSDNQSITWKREKTNSHYVREMASGKLGKPFAFLTLVYEEAWFSDHLIDRNKYEQISDHFFTFINKLS